jgi:hypothetical protein
VSAVPITTTIGVPVADTTVRFTCYPRTEPPPSFVYEIVSAFHKCEEQICTQSLRRALKATRSWQS